ncbi:annexin A13-like [Babylonia areolata]|uniref:annexin A13-like n=1 Tax=Babylonia areolata TaxID=304850 RepID=UPI003FD1A8E3
MAARYCQGTIKAADEETFDAEAQAQTLRDAVNGLGTNEKNIIRVLSGHDNRQRQQIKQMYKTAFGRDLDRDLDDDLGGNFRRLCAYLLLPQPQFDAQCLANALGHGEWDKAIDVLATRNNLQLQGTRFSYKEVTGRELDADIAKHTDGDLKHVLTALAQGNRNEDVVVDQQRVDNEVQQLYKAGVGKVLGTDEDVFTRLLVSRPVSHLQALFQTYQDTHGHSVEQAIDSEMSGATKLAYLTTVRCLRDPAGHFAQCFHEAFKGPGTDDERLMQLIVSHSEIDLQDIADKYREMYSCALQEAIADETSGDYRKLLIRILNPDDDSA